MNVDVNSVFLYDRRCHFGVDQLRGRVASAAKQAG
jgi:hypothetical protein